MLKPKPPVQPGERITLPITGQSHTGDGVGKYKGFTVFVPLVIAGEQVAARVSRVKKNYAHARLGEGAPGEPPPGGSSLSLSSDSCGGCQLQHIAYLAQLEAKRRQVAMLLPGSAVKQVKILPVLGMEEPWSYRNKAQVPFGGWKGKVEGRAFTPLGSHQIIPFDRCLIQQPENDRTIQQVKEWIPELDIPPYDEKKHRGCLRHVMVRTGIHTQEVMVVLVTNGPDSTRKQLVAGLRERVRD